MGSEVRVVTVDRHLLSEGLRQLRSQEATGNMGEGTGRDSMAATRSGGSAGHCDRKYLL